ncbi:MAG: exosortase/archaeosortase family protein [Methanomicrobiaceae archaeon]|nr:exosortase/archaeosortase family protein [Methanomicrobiaceae archaeon]
MKLTTNPGVVAKGWFLVVAVCLILFSLATSASYFKIDILSIWFLSCIGILYISRKAGDIMGQPERLRVAIAGLGIIAFSFLNIPLGFGNPPYSVGDFSILLSGVGIIVFGLLGYRSFLLPVSFPTFVVIGFQLYELLIRHQDWISAPLIPAVVFFSVLILNITGVTTQSNGNLISFIATTGDPITLAVVSDCAGIWSLGTFTAATAIVLWSFPQGWTRQGMAYIAMGYIGTYSANIMRVTIIAYLGYLFGPAGVIEDAHIHVGWVIFTAWMILFWFIFFTRVLGLSLLPSRAKRT